MKLKRDVARQREEKKHIPVNQVIDMLEESQKDPKYLDHENLGKLDTYFRETSFF